MSSETPPNEGDLQNEQADNNEAVTSNSDHAMSRRTMICKTLLAAGAMLFLADDASAQKGFDPTIPPQYAGDSFDEEQLARLDIAPEFMQPAEVALMQRAQEAIFKSYLNPDNIYFFFHNDKHRQIFDEALLAATRHPHDLAYKELHSGIIEVTKSKNSDNQAVPDDLNILINKNDLVFEANKVVIANPTEGKFDEFYTKLDYKRWKNSLISAVARIAARPFPEGLNDAEAMEELESRLEEALNDPSGKSKTLFAVANIMLPQRLKMLVDARNNSGELDDVTDQAYREFEEALPKNATNYGDMAANFIGKFLKISVSIDSEYPSVYMIANDEKSLPLAISREGYFLGTRSRTVIEDGESETIYSPVMAKPRHYRNGVKRRYYDTNPAVPKEKPQVVSAENAEDIVNKILNQLSSEPVDSARLIAKMISPGGSHGRISVNSKTRAMSRIRDRLNQCRASEDFVNIQAVLNYLNGVE